jgi:sugar phosphate isomerase/epimerase
MLELGKENRKGDPMIRTITTRQRSAGGTLSRRDVLKALGLAMVGSQALAVEVAPRIQDAKKNLRLGVFTSVYSHLPLEQAADEIDTDGFSGVVTDYKFADVRFDPLKPDWEAAKRITSIFARYNLHIVAISGYYNVVDPDTARREAGEARMATFIDNWKRLGCPNISTETGTLNKKSEWLECPDNATPGAYDRCRTALERLARAAEKVGAIVSVEPYWRNVICSIDRTEKLFQDISSPALKLVMDPCNYFRKQDLPQMQTMLSEMFRRLGDKIVVAHAKDVKATSDATDTPAAGRGVLDYPLYLRLLAGLNRPLDLVVEHLSIGDVGRARNYVLHHLEKA